MCRDTDIDIGVVKDNQIPWPIRIYYLLTNHRFVARLMLMQSASYLTHINPEVKRFLQSEEMMPYMMADEGEMANLDHLSFFQPGEPYQDDDITLFKKRTFSMMS
jgi:hypothetical protein